jgi:hypothetical protein
MPAGRILVFWSVSLVAIFLGISSTQAQLDQSRDLEQTFFAGAFFDPAVSGQSQLVKYLVTPQINDGSAPQGNELSILARDALRQEKAFLQATNHRLSGSTDGNPIAIYLSRAQHQTFIQSGSNVSVHYTWISVTVHLDIFTDEAAFENSKRFESLYSQLQMVNQPIRTEGPLSHSRLEREYRELFIQAVRELARRSAEDLEWSRSRADAVFQIAKFLPPRKPSVGYDSLLENAINSEGLTVNKQSIKREQLRLQRELMHSMHTFVTARLREKKIDDLAMIPPESPWSDSKVIKLLERRPGMSFMAGKVLSNIDVAAMNGYRIYGLWAGDGTQELERNNSQALILYVPLIAGAVYGVDTNGKLTGSRPLCLKDKKARKPIGRRGIQYRQVVGLPMNRVVFIQAFRASAEVLAERLVELMVLTAGEISGKTEECDLPQAPNIAAPEETHETGFDNGDDQNR